MAATTYEKGKLYQARALHNSIPVIARRMCAFAISSIINCFTEFTMTNRSLCKAHTAAVARGDILSNGKN
jgi:hypothetical protein